MSFLTRYWERLQGGGRAYVTGMGMVVDPAIQWPEMERYREPDLGSYVQTSNAVYVCARLRAQSLSSLPLRLYRVRGDRRTDVTTGPLPDLLQRVNPHWTGQRLIEMTELSLCLWGQAFWFLDRGQGGRGVPREIWWARPDRVKVVPSERDYISHFDYYPPGQHDPLRFERTEVIWFRYPNPVDEYSGLSPLMSARLAADTGMAAMTSNAALFRNGIQMGGVVAPKAGQTLTEQQAVELERSISRRFKGADKAHRWGVLRFEAEFKPLAITPKDAEFMGALQWSFEEVCRAYGVPLDLVGGQRTYANVQEARLAVWTDTLKPEARFLANELTEQLLPLFGNAADEVSFDFSGVDVLQEAELARWERAKEQITAGAMTVNEWRSLIGEDPLPWGDVWWAPMALTPIDGNARPEPPAPEPAPDAPADDAPPVPERSATRAQFAYGSPEHVAMWRAIADDAASFEEPFAAMTTEQFRRQRASIRARLEQADDLAAFAANPFDRARWTRAFRTAARPEMTRIVRASGEQTASEVMAQANTGRSVRALDYAFDVFDPRVRRFIERQAQRFAQQINETTWEALRLALGQALEDGAALPQLMDIVDQVMGDRIRSTPETIARTEVGAAYNGGRLESFRQSGVVRGKQWIASIDDRTRDSHIAVHNTIVGIDEDFVLAAGRGPAPLLIDAASEVVNCRCTHIAVLDVD